MKKFKASTIALWILGLLFAWAVYTVGNYYRYITPPSDLRVSANECFSKNTNLEVTGIVNKSLAIKLYNGLGPNTQQETSVKKIMKMLTTTISDRTVQSINQNTGTITCNANFHTVLQVTNRKKNLKGTVNGSYTISGTKGGLIYELGDGIVSGMNNALNND